VLALAAAACLGSDLVAQSPSTEQTMLSPPGRMVDVGGFRLHLLCTGTGRPDRPTVVLAAGAGDFAVDWGLVQPAIAESTRVCSYDRAGFGWSDAGPEPRTLRQEAAELEWLLTRGGEHPPYLLVGHSIGGLVVRLFQEEHPVEVTGMVLVDPTHESARLGYRGRLVEMRTLASGRPVPPVHGIAEAPPVLASGAALDECRSFEPARVEPPFDQLSVADQRLHLWAARHSKCLVQPEDYLPDELQALYVRRQHEAPVAAPLVVLAAVPSEAPPGVSLADWRREKLDHMADLARLSATGRVVVDTLSGHHIQLDDPALVVRAVMQVIRESGTPGRR
jgi:pimeloyl-ACP methyl ester carboxylesterase